MMKLVDEKKALAEVSNLRKQRKGFAGFDDAQKQIDEKKANLKKLRDTLDDPESKALSEKYNKIQSELDSIKAEQDEAYKGINSLRDERKRLQDDQQAKFTAIKKIKDDYYQTNRAIQKYEYEARQKARERKKAENEKYQQEKRKDRAQQMLAEASDKAYLDEIRRAESLLRFLDPSYSAEKAPLQAPSQFTATAQRKVDDAGIKGVKVVKKDEEDYFAGTGGKKGKKNKKAAAATGDAPPTPTGKYSCPPSVMEDCASMGLEPPMSAADIPEVREKVKAKLDFWKSDQEAQTKKVVHVTSIFIGFVTNTWFRTSPRPRRKLSVSRLRKLPTQLQEPQPPLPTQMARLRPLHPSMKVDQSPTRSQLFRVLLRTSLPTLRELRLRTRQNRIIVSLPPVSFEPFMYGNTETGCGTKSSFSAFSSLFTYFKNRGICVSQLADHGMGSKVS
ncbi:hypothetical protein BKA65DRAFT_155189 [Rhexocercosporidium sp. MPI-PUGE-AT-0058]|nr:hypothetical protein BKA65DRAFT_155189 [Rhexocercosporidium sp. MPI-PUGE-AT-0058]